MYSWSISRKSRNQTKRASNGNGWTLNQMAGAFAILMAFPVLKESEEVVAVTSEAIQDAISTTVETYQEIVTEGGNQLKMLIAAAGIALQVMMTWYLSSKVLNFWCRYGHGNTDKAHLVELRGEVTLWDVAGTKGLHRVRIAGRQVRLPDVLEQRKLPAHPSSLGSADCASKQARTTRRCATWPSSIGPSRLCG